MKDFYVYRVHDRLYYVICNNEDDYPEVVSIWSHPELAQEDANARNERG